MPAVMEPPGLLIYSWMSLSGVLRFQIQQLCHDETGGRAR